MRDTTGISTVRPCLSFLWTIRSFLPSDCRPQVHGRRVEQPLYRLVQSTCRFATAPAETCPLYRGVSGPGAETGCRMQSLPFLPSCAGLLSLHYRLDRIKGRPTAQSKPWLLERRSGDIPLRGKSMHRAEQRVRDSRTFARCRDDSRA